jgi:SPP1 family predicted phage head-tail adaptor
MSFALTLNKRVTIQKRTEGSDEEGNHLTDWQRVCEVWAGIKVGTGMERIRAGAVTSTVQVSIRIRVRAGIDAGMRVVHDAVVYNILAVPPEGTCRTYMDLVCEVIQ